MFMIQIPAETIASNKHHVISKEVKCIWATWLSILRVWHISAHTFGTSFTQTPFGVQSCHSFQKRYTRCRVYSPFNAKKTVLFRPPKSCKCLPISKVKNVSGATSTWKTWSLLLHQPRKVRWITTFQKDLFMELIGCHTHAFTKSQVFSEVRNCRLMKEVRLKLPETHINSFGVCLFRFPTIFSFILRSYISEARLKALFRKTSRCFKHRFSMLFRQPFALKSQDPWSSAARPATHGALARKILCKQKTKLMQWITDVQGRHHKEKIVEKKSTLFPTWINNVLPTTACQPLRKMHLTSI